MACEAARRGQSQLLAGRDRTDTSSRLPLFQELAEISQNLIKKGEKMNKFLGAICIWQPTALLPDAQSERGQPGLSGCVSGTVGEGFLMEVWLWEQRLGWICSTLEICLLPLVTLTLSGGMWADSRLSNTPVWGSGRPPRG